jgi:hypothetical protein
MAAKIEENRMKLKEHLQKMNGKYTTREMVEDGGRDGESLRQRLEQDNA